MRPATSPADWIDELPEELRDAARANAAECDEQGLPALLDDPVALERCARILDTPTGTTDMEVAS